MVEPTKKVRLEWSLDRQPTALMTCRDRGTDSRRGNWPLSARPLVVVHVKLESLEERWIWYMVRILKLDSERSALDGRSLHVVVVDPKGKTLNK